MIDTNEMFADIVDLAQELCSSQEDMKRAELVASAQLSSYGDSRGDHPVNQFDLLVMLTLSATLASTLHKENTGEMPKPHTPGDESIPPAPANDPAIH